MREVTDAQRYARGIQRLKRSTKLACRYSVGPTEIEPTIKTPQSIIATARVQPPDAPAILHGKHATVKPNAGKVSRCRSFSMWQ